MRCTIFALLLVGCNADSLLGTTSTKPPDESCSLYTKNSSGSTMKIASISKPELVGGTEAERATFKKERNDYGAYWSCSTLAFNNTNSWCECPRQSNKSLEDRLAKVNTKITWYTNETPDGG